MDTSDYIFLVLYLVAFACFYVFAEIKCYREGSDVFQWTKTIDAFLKKHNW